MPVEAVDASAVPGLHTEDVAGAVACWQDGVADPPAVARELVTRAARLGVEVREHTALAEVLARRRHAA